LQDQEYREEKINFWDNVYGSDMTPIKKLSMLEPLVDTCDPKQVLTNTSKVLDIDLYTVTKADLDFDSKFSLTVKRRDLCHAVVAYFNVQFSRSHHPIGFSTGPASQYTHWKQTVFYLNDALVCDVDDSIQGRIKVGRNAKNPRDIDIHLWYAVGSEATPSEQFYRLR
jgi:protein arginine N-methyltransferase 1